MRWTRVCLAVLLALALVGPLAACGKKGSPTLPPGKTDKYPRSYPKGS